MPFTEFDYLQHYRETLQKANLGRIRAQFPLKEWQQSWQPAPISVNKQTKITHRVVNQKTQNIVKLNVHKREK